MGELTGTRAEIVKYVNRRGAARMAQIMKDLGLTTGSAGGHLYWLVQHKHLERPERGVYVIPGTDPVLPPPPSLSEAVTKRNQVVWAGLSQQERDRRVEALARGRRDAARLRREGRSAG